MTTNGCATPAVARRKIDDLKAHPKQAQLFTEPPEHEVRELAKDLKANGQLTPVEVLPDGTLVCGHKRVLAARHLGWDEVDAWVRQDLAGDPQAAERRLIEDNLNRRQMGPLEVARCYQHLRRLGRPPHRGPLATWEKGDLRDDIGRRLGISGRNLDRYLRVLEGTPPEVQDAVAAGKLPLTAAEKVAGLARPRQEQLAAEIRGGGGPAEVVRKYLPRATGRHRHVGDAAGAFLKALERGVDDLEGRAEEVLGLTAEDVDVLGRAGAVIETLRRGRRARRPGRVSRAGQPGRRPPRPEVHGQ
jgi:ParB family chromosome partitioning protein